MMFRLEFKVCKGQPFLNQLYIDLYYALFRFIGQNGKRNGRSYMDLVSCPGLKVVVTMEHTAKVFTLLQLPVIYIIPLVEINWGQLCNLGEFLANNPRNCVQLYYRNLQSYCLTSQSQLYKPGDRIDEDCCYL